MDRVHLAVNEPVSEIDVLALGIYPNREHIGILHRVNANSSLASARASSTVRLLHWGWQDAWGDEIPDGCAFWLSPGISDEEKAVVAGYCRLILKRNAGRSLAFGFSPPDSVFDENWDLCPVAARIGVTCAVFVLGIFHRAGVQLLQSQTWRVRDDDQLRWVKLLSLLAKTHPGSTQQIEQRARAVIAGQIRFRPLEVAGAVWRNRDL